MKLEKKHVVGLIGAVIIIAAAFIFMREDKIFYFILGIAAVIGIGPFLLTIITENKKEKEDNEMFLEFARNLAESVKAGTPISRSIINLREKYYGTLTPHIHKLANQIDMGIPVKDALSTFAYDVGSKSVTRAITMISEAERAGGEIEKILDSVAKSVAEIEKLKKERSVAISGLVVQGYIIFLVFIVIMLVLQFKILPMAADFGGGMSGGGDSGLGALSVQSVSVAELSKPFLYLLIAQGFFAGLTIGKLAEGSIKPGLKHSFVMMLLAYLITTGVKLFLG